MAAKGQNVNVNISLRTDARPEELLKEILLSPLIYIRLVGILFSIIVFGCVSDKVDGRMCYYNQSNACSFAIAVGVIAFLLCIVFLVKDVLFVVIDYSDNVVIKKVIIVVDAITNGFWAFMWFVCFCFTADQLRRFNSGPLLYPNSAVRNCANSGVAFSFFSIFAWVAIVAVNVIYFLRIWRGTDISTRPGGSGPSGYASFPEGSADQPGEEDEEHKPQQQYQPPEY